MGLFGSYSESIQLLENLLVEYTRRSALYQELETADLNAFNRGVRKAINILTEAENKAREQFEKSEAPTEILPRQSLLVNQPHSDAIDLGDYFIQRKRFYSDGPGGYSAQLYKKEGLELLAERDFHDDESNFDSYFKWADEIILNR